MKKSTWNPVRRNRNIGTVKSGYSSDNKFVVPEKWADYRVFWERLENPVACPLSVQGHDITLLVEPTRPGYFHACTPGDIERLLSLIDVEHLEEVDLVVFRQPKKKEEILHPVWGRFIYYADIGKYSGSGVYIEAVATNSTIKWGNKLSPFQRKELEALEIDGHRIERVKRGYDIHTTPDTVRNTQLFRTLPHEIGHAVDYLTHSLNPSIETDSENESEYISEVYRSKPTRDKEEFANRYAREFYEKYSSDGKLPFDRIYTKESIIGLGLCEPWFL
jgi:hypothetical protein